MGAKQAMQQQMTGSGEEKPGHRRISMKPWAIALLAGVIASAIGCGGTDRPIAKETAALSGTWTLEASESCLDICNSTCSYGVSHGCLSYWTFCPSTVVAGQPCDPSVLLDCWRIMNATTINEYLCE